MSGETFQKNPGKPLCHYAMGMHTGHAQWKTVLSLCVPSMRARFVNRAGIMTVLFSIMCPVPIQASNV